MLLSSALEFETYIPPEAVPLLAATACPPPLPATENERRDDTQLRPASELVLFAPVLA